jgi:leucyl aminopeptidase
VIAAGKNAAAFRRELKRLEAVFAGVDTARDLANTPAADLTPDKLAAFAKAMCKKHGMTYRELTADQLRKGNYVGLTAVGQGSVNPPRMFTITYKPAGAAKRKPAQLCFVGKGITFDTGGISIKPWDGMWDMKADMGGSAAVIGTMQAIALLKPGIEITGVVATAENMPDGRSYRPGDVLTYRNGRSVEIHSTDAEGRLVLADALIYAQQTLKQKQIVEFSTLTGACVRALGHQYIGLMTRSEKLASGLTAAGLESGEEVWRLPLHPEYRKMLESHVADIKNSGGALAGASTAGMFLYEFIEEGTEYAHLDIASTFLATTKEKFWSQVGATGSGVRLALELVRGLAG